MDPSHCPHALLFVGKDTEKHALELAASLRTSKADLHHFYPEGKTDQHPIASIRKLISDVSLAPFEGKSKVFIVHQAEKMLPTSANALLKTLEEPSEHTCIILLTAHPEKLLATIRSRCQMRIFHDPIEEDRSKILAYLSRELKAEELEGESMELLWETIMLWYRDRYLLEEPEGEAYLSFPGYREAIASYPLLPLGEVQERLSQAHLAQQRAFKLPVVLEMLFF